MSIASLYKTEDWKKEKHVPVIECAEKAHKGEPFEIKVSLGKEIDHPNTTAHHIRWIRLYFKPEGQDIAYELATAEFTAHGESAKGPDEGPAKTHHAATVTVMLESPGDLIATAYCNIHGLWESSKALELY